MLDAEACYPVLVARDPRFDGKFFVGVKTTGVYCRPVCPARTPFRKNCEFFESAAAAEHAGYRACFRCRPELAPGSSSTDARPRLVAAAATRIRAGALNHGTLDELAREFGVSARHLRRSLQKELGLSPIELAQSARLGLARQLILDGHARLSDVAFASGFSSLRRFNTAIRASFGRSPSELRRTKKAQADARFVLTLGYRQPFAWDELITYLGERAVEGIEQVLDGTYLRSVRLGEDIGWISVECVPERRALRVSASVELSRSLLEIAGRVRRLFDLDAEPSAIDEHLRRDRRLSRLVERTPGLRVPGAFDGFELAVRILLGQRVTIQAAGTFAGRISRAFGERLSTPHPGLGRVWPKPDALAEATDAQYQKLGIAPARAHTLRELARAVLERRIILEPHPEFERTLACLRAIPGVGPWTASCIGMRVLGLPDVFPEGDLHLKRALVRASDSASGSLTRGFGPWGAYAAQHLWNASSEPRALT